MTANFMKNKPKIQFNYNMNAPSISQVSLPQSVYDGTSVFN